jgi:hypothetical protein
MVAKRKVSREAIMASIHSPNTPDNLKKGLRKYARERGWIK